jgi:hypothetical protein
MFEYRRRVVHQAWAMAKQQFASVAAERNQLRQDLTDVRRQRDEALAMLDELRTAIRARHAAEAELASLYRERDIAKAQAAVRDPAAPLH